MEKNVITNTTEHILYKRIKFDIILDSKYQFYGVYIRFFCFSDPPFCPRGSGFTYLNTSGLCIKAFTKPATWMEARTLCWDQRLRLVALDTQAKIDSIKQSLNDKLSGVYHNEIQSRFVFVFDPAYAGVEENNIFFVSKISNQRTFFKINIQVLPN